MQASVGDIIAIMEDQIAPPSQAEPWDHVGLCAGDRAWPARRVWVALDPLAEVVEAALADKAGLLICHHPLLFAGIHGVDLSTPAGRIIASAISGKMAIYCAHTNLDKAAGGTTDVLSRRIGLSGRFGLDASGPFLACVGALPLETDLCTLAALVKKQVGAQAVRFAGPPGLRVKRAAVCAGSGASLIADFLASDAEVFITGDLRYHDARTIREHGKGCVDIGHFASEHLVVEPLAEALGVLAAGHGFEVSIVPCCLEKEPFTCI